MAENSENENEYDSDKELQVAYQKGLLKGLVKEELEPEKLICNKTGMEQALMELKRNQLEWLERLDLTVDPVPPPKAMLQQIGDNPDDLESVSIHDDFKRESKFYRLAQAAIREGIPRLHALGVATKRPQDYFAEMAKSDDHMKKLREKLQSIRVSKERSEKAKKLRELRKYGKQVQQDVLQKKQKEKRETLDAVKKFRKGKISSLDFLDEKNGGASQQKNKANMPNKRRNLKDKKFGFGGQKKRSKYNTKSSTNDFTSDPSSRPGKTGGKPGGKPGGKGMKKKNAAKIRPGKQRRQNMKKR